MSKTVERLEAEYGSCLSRVRRERAGVRFTVHECPEGHLHETRDVALMCCARQALDRDEE